MMEIKTCSSSPDVADDDKPRFQALHRGDSSSSMLHISETPITWTNWFRHVHWINTSFVIILPCICLFFTLWVPFKSPTFVFGCIYGGLSGLGVTAGYHRLWSHRTYNAKFALRLFLAVLGSAVGVGTIRQFVKDHRSHHRWTDTDKDPHSIDKGLMYSHMLWMILKRNPKRMGRSNIADVEADPIVVWQHRNYPVIFLFVGLIVPTGVCGLLWDDWLGGFLYAGMLRIFVVQQNTFCINSVAHWLGDQPFDTCTSARNNFIAALVTNGEGYHNFHHQFPSDYRAGVEWYEYDPTKWSIYIWERLGFAYNVKRFRANEILKRRIQEKQKKLDKKSELLEWGTALHDLPILSWDDFIRRAENGEALISICGIVYDISSFAVDHPGGPNILTSVIGKDTTAEFYGGVYNHSKNAHNLLDLLKVAVIRGGGEVEIWKDSANRS